MRRLVSMGALLCATSLSLDRAGAHEGSHDHMPHQITAGLIPLYVTHYAGAHPALVAGPIDERSVGALGVTVGYGYTLAELIELRIRSEYVKPFPARDALERGLHEFRGVLGVSGVLPLRGQALQLAFGPEVGVAAWRLTEGEDPTLPFESSHAVGYTLSFASSLRWWLTHHTGLWLELGFGVADASGAGEAPGDGIASRWPIRAALGWADRF